MENIIPVQLKQNNALRKKIFPVFLALGIILIDQVTKMLVFNYIEFGTIFAEFFGGLLRITHVWNTGAAFSFGQSFPEIVRIIILKVGPLLVLIGIMIFYFKTEEFKGMQRWWLWGIIGGGIGNIIDRFFRPGGVIDFIDVDFFDINFAGFYMTRWPVFNIADMSIIIFGFLLCVTFIKDVWKETKNQKKT
ncbi:MAG: signal peptidase II [Spirochaetales bacterium]